MVPSPQGNLPLAGGVAGQLYAGILKAASPQDFLSSLSSIPQFASPEIAAAFVALDTAGAQPIERFSLYEGTKFRVLHRAVSPDLAAHDIGKTLRETSGISRQVRGYVASFKSYGIWFLASARDDMVSGKDFSDFRTNCMLNWCSTFYPDVVPLHIRSSSLLRFLGEIAHNEQSHLDVLRSTIRYPKAGYQLTDRVESLDAVRERLDGEGAFLDRVTISLLGEHGYVVTMGRDGQLSYHAGDLIRLLGDIAKLFSRERASRKHVYSALQEGFRLRDRTVALDVDFGPRARVDDVDSAEALVRVLEAHQALSVTVLHGNPYLHVAVTDLAGGATFSLYSHGTTGLRIYPGLTFKQAAIEHLLDWISQNFADIQTVKEQLISVTSPYGDKQT